MSQINSCNSKQNNVFAGGILTSLVLQKKRNTGCIWFAVAFLGCSLIAVVILSVVFFLNATKIFSNLGLYALTPTMHALENDVTTSERGDFSNAYVKIFSQIEKNGITAIEPWAINAMTNLATSAKDHKISREECASFILLVESGSEAGRDEPGKKPITTK